MIQKIQIKYSKPTQKVVKEFTRIGNRFLEDFGDTVERIVVKNYEKDRHADVAVYGHKGINYFFPLACYEGRWEAEYANIF